MYSRNPHPELTPAEIEALLAQVVAGAVSPQTAVELLVVKGHERMHAEELVWTATKRRPPAADRPKHDAR